MNDSPLAAWLALHHLPGLGTSRIHKLYRHFGSALAVVRAPRPLLQGLGLGATALQALDAFVETNDGALQAQVERSLEWAQQAGQHLLCPEDDQYPALLRWLPDPPAILYLRGRLELLRQPQLAVVGSRHPSAGGLDNARAFAGELAREGLLITSGLALGVDAAAHEAALKCSGATLAVLGTGVDRPYPAANRTLAAVIAQQGLMVSEFPLGTPPKAANFPRRNRIISGLSMGTLVVEASLRSGSLITARLALEQGREVYAIPGSIHNPQARGCHHLIKQGAKLVETVADIAEELPALLAYHQAQPLPETFALFPAIEPVSAGLGPEPAPDEDLGAMAETDTGRQLLQALGYDPVSPDLLVMRTGLPPQVVSAELMSLEISGRVTRTAGGYQRC